MQAEPTQGGLKGMWQAFLPGGSDASDGEYHNVAGNMLGSWVFRINYDADSWKLGFYGDHFFEDHSAMFFLDYDGYGTGDQWNTHTKRRYYRYKLKDMLLGLELNLKYGTWLRNVVLEYIYTNIRAVLTITIVHRIFQTILQVVITTIITPIIQVGSIGDR